MRDLGTLGGPGSFAYTVNQNGEASSHSKVAGRDGCRNRFSIVPVLTCTTTHPWLVFCEIRFDETHVASDTLLSTFVRLLLMSRVVTRDR